MCWLSSVRQSGRETGRFRHHKTLDGLGEDDVHACATINSENVLSVQLLNTTKKDISIKLQIEDQYADLTIVANSLQTVRVQL